MSINVHEHMKEFAVASFGHALWHVIMTGRGHTPWTEPFALIHAAHGGELLIKSVISQVDPLLIFNKIPQSFDQLESNDRFDYLVKEGRTVQYRNLPNLLLNTTGFSISRLSEYNDMGDLRNTIMHFTVPNKDYRSHVLSYLCNVVDPVLRKFWGTQIFQEVIAGWDEQDYYLFDEEPWIPNALEECGIHYDGWIPSPDSPRWLYRKDEKRCY